MLKYTSLYGSSDHNQIHCNIKVKTRNTYKNNGEGTLTKATIIREKISSKCRLEKLANEQDGKIMLDLFKR